MSVVGEAFCTVNVDVSLTLFASRLGLAPLLFTGTWHSARFLAPMLRTTGASLAALVNCEPGGSANCRSGMHGGGTRARRA